MDADGNRSNTQNDGEKQDGHKAARFFLGWLVALNKGITKLLKKALGPDYIAVTEDEVLDMVNALAQTPDDDGDGENVIEESSAQMINNIFEFKDLTAGDVMTHRTNIVGVDMSVSLDDIIYLALDMGFSRIPVYEGSIDRIVGIIIVKDLLCLVGKSQADLDGFDIRDFVRSVNFVPESCPCSEVFKSLTSLKSGMAVVADEYGGTAGIVTLEDIIEAVMGNIQDEYDDERSEIVKVGEDEYDIDGEADPDEVFRLFGVELPEEHDYETIAGFITDKLGYIPEGERGVRGREACGNSGRGQVHIKGSCFQGPADRRARAYTGRGQRLMARVSQAKKKRAAEVIELLRGEYPDVKCALIYEKPHELLIATRLSAQCTDKRVNMVTPALFERFPSIDAFAEAEVGEVEEYIRTCGLYKTKAQDIVNMCVMLRDIYGGKVPDSIEELTKLPGVGRKTANLIVGDLYGKPAMVCDTHVIRLSNRLGLADSTDAGVVEKQLREIVPPEEGLMLCHRLVHHGRDVCDARAPKCEACVLRNVCPSKDKPVRSFRAGSKK